MNIRKPTHLKIILRKKGGRRIRGCLGITVTKAHGPTTPPAATIIGKGKDKMKAPTSMTGSDGTTYAQTLRALATTKKDKATDNIPDFEPPQLAENLERKL